MITFRSFSMKKRIRKENTNKEDKKGGSVCLMLRLSAAALRHYLQR